MDRPPRVGLRMFLQGHGRRAGDLRRHGRRRRGRGLLPDPGPGERSARSRAGRPSRSRRSPRRTSRRPSPASRGRSCVLGSDRRAKTSTDARIYGQNEKPHSDTIVLIRLDSKRNRIAVLSLPRDLAVTIPGYADNTKINEAYDEGGAGLTLKTVRHLFESATGKEFKVNGVVDVSFNGFQRAVNYIKGVYVDVDREYYNPEGTGFAAIDIKPGYQKLVGSDALAYVRFRHTDSDLFRNARQQDFLRQAAAMPAVDELKSIDDATDVRGGDDPVLPLQQGLPRAQEHRGPAEDRVLPRGQPRAGQPDRAQGRDREREPDRGHAPLHLQRERPRGLRRVHDRREGHPQPGALDQGQEGQEAGQGVAHERAGERHAAGRGHGRAGRAPAEVRCRSTSPSTARPARATPTTRRASTRSRTSAARSTAPTGSRSGPARRASTTACRG